MNNRLHSGDKRTHKLVNHHLRAPIFPPSFTRNPWSTPANLKLLCLRWGLGFVELRYLGSCWLTGEREREREREKERWPHHIRPELIYHHHHHLEARDWGGGGSDKCLIIITRGEGELQSFLVPHVCCPFLYNLSSFQKLKEGRVWFLFYIARRVKKEGKGLVTLGGFNKKKLLCFFLCQGRSKLLSSCII